MVLQVPVIGSFAIDDMRGHDSAEAGKTLKMFLDRALMMAIKALMGHGTKFSNFCTAGT